MESGICHAHNANVRNTGLITNLSESCVEVPVLVDRRHPTPVYVGACRRRSGFDQTNIGAQENGNARIMEKNKKTKSFRRAN